MARAVLLALVFASACDLATSRRLEGRWRGVRAEGVGPEASSAANAFATSTELYVKGSTLTVTSPKGRQVGRFRVVAESPTTLIIAADKDRSAEPETFTFVDNKTMKWSALEGKYIVFTRE
jgi:hypothetical protein